VAANGTSVMARRPSSESGSKEDGPVSRRSSAPHAPHDRTVSR
jgi:hypothetical protein